MQDRTRTTVFIVLCLFLVALLAIWWYFGFSLDFMRFFASEPPAIPSIDVNGRPAGTGIVQCFPTSQSVPVGTHATLTAASGNGNYNWFSPEGNPSGSAEQDFIGATYEVSYTTPGTKQVTVTSGRLGNPQIEDSVACTIIVTP